MFIVYSKVHHGFWNWFCDLRFARSTKRNHWTLRIWGRFVFFCFPKKTLFDLLWEEQYQKLMWLAFVDSPSFFWMIYQLAKVGASPPIKGHRIFRLASTSNTYQHSSTNCSWITIKPVELSGYKTCFLLAPFGWVESDRIQRVWKLRKWIIWRSSYYKACFGSSWAIIDDSFACFSIWSCSEKVWPVEVMRRLPA